LRAELLDRLAPEVGLGLLPAEQAALDAAVLEVRDPRRGEERAGLRPRVERHPLGRDPARARHEHDVARRDHAIDVAEELDLIGEELDVVAVNVNVLVEERVRLVDVVERVALHFPLRAAAHLRRALRARRQHGRAEDGQDEKGRPQHDSARISEEYHGRARSRSAPIRKIEPATTTRRGAAQARPSAATGSSTAEASSPSERAIASRSPAAIARGDGAVVHTTACTAGASARSISATALSFIAPNTSVTPPD